MDKLQFALNMDMVLAVAMLLLFLGVLAWAAAGALSRG